MPMFSGATPPATGASVPPPYFCSRAVVIGASNSTVFACALTAVRTRSQTRSCDPGLQSNRCEAKVPGSPVMLIAVFHSCVLGRRTTTWSPAFRSATEARCSVWPPVDTSSCTCIAGPSSTSLTAPTTINGLRSIPSATMTVPDAPAPEPRSNTPLARRLSCPLTWKRPGESSKAPRNPSSPSGMDATRSSAPCNKSVSSPPDGFTANTAFTQGTGRPAS